MPTAAKASKRKRSAKSKESNGLYVPRSFAVSEEHLRYLGEQADGARVSRSIVIRAILDAAIKSGLTIQATQRIEISTTRDFPTEVPMCESLSAA